MTMQPIFVYLAKMLIVSALLLGYYWGFLRNRSFHRYNRFYLLFAVALSVITPFISIPLHLQPAVTQENNLARGLQAITLGGWGDTDGISGPVQHQGDWLTSTTVVGLCYALGLIICLFTLVRSLIYILRIRQKYPYQPIDDIRIYDTTEPGTPFSFFRQLFWNRDIPFDTKQGQQIFRHELYHIRQGHSLDILFLELLCCIAWFNPFFYLYKKELKAIHEFLADESAIAKNNRLDYAELLVTHAVSQQNTGLTHPFSQHELKRRIMILTQSDGLHHKSGLYSRIAILPLLLVLICSFTIRLAGPAHLSTGTAPMHNNQPLTVVIDAGHGGIDPGTQTALAVEKDIVLTLAKKINELASEYNISVVLTRNSDQLPGNASDKQEGLLKRVAIANASKADLFISLHVNNTGSEDTPAPVAGFEAYISRRRTDERGLILANSLLQQLSTIYTTTTAVRQRENQGIFVLDKNNRPAVILECGYINRAEDLQFITNTTNQEKIARKILEGIVQYARSTDRH